MAWSFTSNKPVYLQLAERITKSILSGKYATGQQIPSVRQLALIAAVNPNTVQHAFTELEYEGIIVSKGTMGRYVTEDTQIIDICRKRMAQQFVIDFMENMKQLSLSEEDVMNMIKEVTK